MGGREGGKGERRGPMTALAEMEDPNLCASERTRANVSALSPCDCVRLKVKGCLPMDAHTPHTCSAR